MGLEVFFSYFPPITPIFLQYFTIQTIWHYFISLRTSHSVIRIITLSG